MPKKPPKDPNAPKTWVGSFFVYSNERRAELKQKHPGMTALELNKHMGQLWKNEDEAVKTRYQERVKRDKKEYALKLAEYKMTDEYEQHQKRLREWQEEQKENGKATVSSRSKKGKPKDSNAPKKPLTSFFLFAAQERPKVKAANPEKSTTEVAKAIGVKWAAMSEDEKSPFVSEAKRTKNEWDRAMAAYQLTDECKEHEARVRDWALMKESAMPKVKLPSKPKDKNRPPKPATSYFLFAKEIREGVTKANPTAKITEIAKLIGARWKEVSEEEKAQYSARAKQLKDAWKIEIARYEGSEDDKAYQLQVAQWEAECEARRQKALAKVKREKAKEQKGKEKAKKAKSKKKAATKGGSSKSKRKVRKRDQMSEDESSESDSDSSSSGSSSGSGSTTSGSYTSDDSDSDSSGSS